ncbi:MAG: uL15m family ribosomal protein, partial [Candidatus Nitrosotenuis sp.]
ASLGYDKLLGGGQVKNAYSVKVERYTESAAEKIKQAGGEVLAVE